MYKAQRNLLREQAVAAQTAGKDAGGRRAAAEYVAATPTIVLQLLDDIERHAHNGWIAGHSAHVHAGLADAPQAVKPQIRY